jgi:aspartokinase-like uncharacterized kinase
MRIVKLGGSLFHGPWLRQWLAVLVAHGGGRVVVVPGGGPFADRVRAAQRHWHFDDTAGHRMAMLGMAQYGLMLAGLRSELIPAADEEGMRRTLAQGRVAVWLPTGCERIDAPRDWSVTSDSLAAWLARRLSASHLLLVKSVRLDAAKINAAELARCGIVDEAFPGVLARADVCCRILNAADHALFATALGQDEAVGTAVSTI